MQTESEPGTPCLSDNDVLDLLAGGGSEPAREHLRAHLDRCEACRGLLAALVGPASEPSRPAAAKQSVPASLAAGALVGPYRVLAQIGSGGMGVVYAAFDPRLDRKVALKLIRPELSTLDPDLERRLIRESKAMARLSHANVLAVHDIGVHAGQVYVAMDLVDGQTLRAWLKSRPRWQDVLAAFVQAGRGLAAAHAAGLVHRDFKPDNVLLDRSGRVLVTDFGLARPLAASERPTADAARREQMLGRPPGLARADATLEHLGRRADDDEASLAPSPARAPTDATRQHLGDPADTDRPALAPGPTRTAKDATLEHLGSPADIDRPSLAPDPSRAPTDATLEQLGGPADTALTRTGALVGTPAYMAPEQRRGEAADERSDVFSFCVALHEGLYGARPPADATTSPRPEASDIRVPKWLRRAVLRGLEPEPGRRPQSMTALLTSLSPRRPLVLTMSLGTGLLAAAVGLTAAAFTGTDARAEPCAAAAEHLADAWSDERRAEVRAIVLRDETDARARFVWQRVESTLDEHVATWRRVHAELCAGDSDFSPERRAGARCLDARAVELAAATAVLSRGTGDDPDRALPVIDGLRAPDTCLRPDASQDRLPPPEDAADRAEVASLRADLAEVRALQAAGAFAEARARVEPLVSRAEALAYRPLAAEALLVQGILAAESADPHAGARIVRRAANDAEAIRHDRVAAEAWAFLAFHAAQQLVDLERASEYAALADAAIERLGGDLDLAARVAYYRGVAAWRAGDPTGAREWYERAAKQMQAAGRQPHVDLLEALGLAYSDEGRFTAAIEQFTRLLALRRERLGPDHPGLGMTHSNLAAELHELGRDDEALVHMQAAMDLRAAAFGPDHPEVGRLHFDLGEILRALGRHEEGLTHNARALAIVRQAHGEEHPDVATIVEHRAGLLLGQGRHEEAVTLLREALAVHQRTRGDKDPLVARCQLNLGDALRRAGRPAEAEGPQRAALSQFEALLPEGNAYLGYARTYLARTLIALGREAEALPLLERAVAGYPEVDIHPYQVALSRAALAQALWAASDDHDRARDLARAAADTLSRGGAGWADEHQAVERWLAERADPPIATR
ncbi:tetratricopeptide repeat protein [Nannocystis pusilla]|uniref:tetratricopeptide repeat protein n=1 Tax=Nannocystis pusilla TaxID=889268 RepID=UPI003BF00551